MDLENIFDGLPEPPQNGTVEVQEAKAPEYASRKDIGPNRMIFVDELEKGSIFFTPDRCPGWKDHPISGQRVLACGFPAANHVEGEYHEGVVIRRRDVPMQTTSMGGLEAVIIVFENEDGDQQAFGPVPGFMPIRQKLDLGEIGNLG